MQWSEVGAVLGTVLGIGGIAVSIYGLRHSASSSRASAVSADAAQKSVEIAERALEAEERRYRENRSADLRIEHVGKRFESSAIFLVFRFRNAGPATANGVELSLQFVEHPGSVGVMGSSENIVIRPGEIQELPAHLPKEKRVSGWIWVKVNVHYYDREPHHLEYVYMFGNLLTSNGLGTALRVIALDGKRRSDSPPPPPSHDPFPIPEWLQIAD